MSLHWKHTLQIEIYITFWFEITQNRTSYLLGNNSIDIMQM